MFRTPALSVLLAIAAPLAVLAGPGPAVAQNGEEGKPVYQECLRQGIETDQCRCYSRYVRLNGGEYLDQTLLVRIMWHYPLSQKQKIGDEVFKKVYAPSTEVMWSAVTVLTDAANHCSRSDP
eukprot:gene25290-25425_t